VSCGLKTGQARPHGRFHHRSQRPRSSRPNPRGVLSYPRRRRPGSAVAPR